MKCHPLSLVTEAQVQATIVIFASGNKQVQSREVRRIEAFKTAK